MEGFLLDAIADSYPHPADPEGYRLQVERKVLPTSLSIDESAAEDEDAYPVTVTLRHLTEEEATPTQKLSNLSDGLFRSNLAEDDVRQMLAQSEGRNGTQNGTREETVKAKYVVGCDGAHSWTRKSLGPEFEMQGEMTDYIWGVMDIVPITDFREFAILAGGDAGGRKRQGPFSMSLCGANVQTSGRSEPHHDSQCVEREHDDHPEGEQARSLVYPAD